MLAKRMCYTTGGSSIVAGCVRAGGSISVDSCYSWSSWSSSAIVDLIHHSETMLIVHPDYTAYVASKAGSEI